jgi:Spy/CpxP family protein refolding chaperone
MTKIKMVLCGCIGLYVFAMLSLAQAQNAPGGDSPSSKGHSGQRIAEIYSQLNLTDDQKRQVESNKQQHRARTESTRKQLRAEKEAFQVELMKPQMDMARINDIHRQIKVLQSQMEDDKLASILAVRSILTPEQFSKFISLMHKHKQNHEQAASDRQENEERGN